jgi:predicted proteasome-type protease
LLRDDEPTIWNAQSMFDCRRLACREALREIQRRDGPSACFKGIDARLTLSTLATNHSVKIKRLFHLYPQGNFIESEETPHFQLMNQNTVLILTA